MKNLLRQHLDLRVSWTLALAVAALAIAGCRSHQPKAGQVPVHIATPESSPNPQALAGQPSRYHIDADMRPVTTNTVVAQYDVALLQAVAQRWYRLLDTVPAPSATGKVVVEFSIPPDGKVPEARISESTVDKSLALICQKAVLDASPFAPWPQEMRQALPNSLRTATFTFSFH